MTKLIESILAKKFADADDLIAESFENIMVRKLHEAKKRTAANMCEQTTVAPGKDNSDAYNGSENRYINKSLSTNTPSKAASEIRADDMLPDERARSNDNQRLNSSLSRLKPDIMPLSGPVQHGSDQVNRSGKADKVTPVSPIQTNAAQQTTTVNKVNDREVAGSKSDYGGKPVVQKRQPEPPVETNDNPDPAGKQQLDRKIRNATIAKQNGYSSVYMPKDPNFEVRAAAPPAHTNGKLQMHEQEVADGKSSYAGRKTVGAKSDNERAATDALIQKNTEKLIDMKSRGMLPADSPITTRLEEEQLDEARIKLVKARIRNGKIQRRKKVSNVPGMTLRGGKLQRMSPAERRRRKMGAKRAVRKKAGKMGRILMKRSRSLRKRKAMGL